MNNLTAFLSIPWEDVLFPKVFCMLSNEDLINMQAADPAFYDVVNMYIGKKTIIDSSIQTWDVTRAMLPQTRSLKSLILPVAIWLHDVELIDVLHRNPLLKELYLTCGEMITIRGLSSILQVRSLTRLSLCGIPSVDDSFIALLGKSHPHLEELDLIGTTTTDRGLIPMFQCCRRIRKIKFTIQKGITRKTVCALVNNCRSLETYEVSIDHEATLELISEVMGAFDELLHKML